MSRFAGSLQTSGVRKLYFLSELDEKGGTGVLQFLERTRNHIRKVVEDTSDWEWHGKHLVVRFSDDETYYRYLAHFSSDGAHGGSAGCFLKSQYCHIVYPASWSMDDERATLVHEMTHNFLADLPLPRWLDEALAMAFQGDVSGSGNEPVTSDLNERHREYWNASVIQEFWMGSSFGTPDGQELSYSLARILLNLIYHDYRPAPDDFRRFVLASDWHDAGANACREYLKVELGQLAGSFLGPGEWAPKPTDWERYYPRPNSGTEQAEEGDMSSVEQPANDRRGPICE